MLNCFTLFFSCRKWAIFNIEPMDGFVNLGHDVNVKLLILERIKELKRRPHILQNVRNL